MNVFTRATNPIQNNIFPNNISLFLISLDEFTRFTSTLSCPSSTEDEREISTFSETLSPDLYNASNRYSIGRFQ